MNWNFLVFLTQINFIRYCNSLPYSPHLGKEKSLWNAVISELPGGGRVAGGEGGGGVGGWSRGRTCLPSQVFWRLWTLIAPAGEQLWERSGNPATPRMPCQGWGGPVHFTQHLMPMWKQRILVGCQSFFEWRLFWGILSASLLASLA